MPEPLPSEIDQVIAGIATEDEAALIAAAQLDRRDFAPLYERYVTPIYRYCYHRLGNREAAEDITSLVFTKALAALPRYRPTGSFRSWLFAIAFTTITDHIRRERPTVSIVETELLAMTPDPETAAIAGIEQAEVHRLLSKLPAAQRHVLELRLSGLSSPEVATILGCRATAVRSLQFRAVARLRAHLTTGIAVKERATNAER